MIIRKLILIILQRIEYWKTSNVIQFVLSKGLAKEIFKAKIKLKLMNFEDDFLILYIYINSNICDNK